MGFTRGSAWRIPVAVDLAVGTCTHGLACRSHKTGDFSHPDKTEKEHAGFTPDQARERGGGGRTHLLLALVV